jgi:hypothetical protein
LKSAVQICIEARGDVSIRLLREVIVSAPRANSNHDEGERRNSSLCYRLIEETKACDSEQCSRVQDDIDRASQFLLRGYMEMPEDMHDEIRDRFERVADALLIGPLADIFNGDTNLTPEAAFGGAIILLDLPREIYGQVGLCMQAAFTRLWQRACARRDVKRMPRPVFWLAYEAQQQMHGEMAGFLDQALAMRVAPLLIAGSESPAVVESRGSGLSRSSRQSDQVVLCEAEGTVALAGEARAAVIKQ